MKPFKLSNHFKKISEFKDPYSNIDKTEDGDTPMENEVRA